MENVKTVSIFGATGSIGLSAAEVILSSRDYFDVQVVTANTNTSKLAEVAKSLNAKKAVIADVTLYEELKEKLSNTNIEVFAGRESLNDCATINTDIALSGITGMAGIQPMIHSIQSSSCVAIANKEPLVAAGSHILKLAAQCNTKILPVDSEHNAIFQVFDFDNKDSIDRLILTASGGPFLYHSIDELQQVKPKDALKHPNWDMGAKISIDSATMMNKALEIIEAYYLFDMPENQIDVIIHPQSIIHSMVEYKDGSILAQMGAPDMKTPIAYTLGWPKRINSAGQKLDFSLIKKLEFLEPDLEKFQSLSLAYDCIKSGANACIAFNASNEVAVESFLRETIGFTDIIDVVKNSLESLPNEQCRSIEDIITFDNVVREHSLNYINSNLLN